MRPWEITIRRVSNGFSLKWYEEINETQLLENDLVIEEDQDEFSEIEAMQELLLEVKDYFGHFGSKHDKRRLRVIIEDQNED